MFPRSREPMVSSNSLVAMALLMACIFRPYWVMRERLNSSGLGLALEISYNSGEEIMENIKQVVLSLVEGLAIAVLVLWLFLGEWKASAIVAGCMRIGSMEPEALSRFVHAVRMVEKVHPIV